MRSLLSEKPKSMLELAENIIQSQVTVTGVQPKLSLGLQRITKPSEVLRIGDEVKAVIKGIRPDYNAPAKVKDFSFGRRAPQTD